MNTGKYKSSPWPFVLSAVTQGGSGSTVTIGRLAVALASMGKKVLLVDFDLWRPGIWLSMALEEEIGPPLEDFLFGDDRSAICPVDLTGPLKTRMEFHSLRGGASLEFNQEGLLFAVSPSLNSAFKVSTACEDQIGQSLERLISASRSVCEGGVDIILIDCPPGLSPLSLAAMEKSHIVFLFYRLCRQHVFSVGCLSKFLHWEYYAKKDFISVLFEHENITTDKQLEIWLTEYLREAFPSEFANLFFNIPYNPNISMDESFNLIDKITSAPFVKLARLILGRIDLFVERSQQRMGFDDITCSVESMQVPKKPV